MFKKLIVYVIEYCHVVCYLGANKDLKAILDRFFKVLREKHVKKGCIEKNTM